jgi:3',5'-cyclic AMP phosphodiesterase CpdA
MSVFRLAHLSDPHLAPVPRPRLIDLLGKRAIGYANWLRGRRERHLRAVASRIVADIHAAAPDHIAVTGDLVNIALEAEFAQARAWLAEVGAPDRVSLVPGNHDAYVPAMRTRFAEVWADYMRGDGPPIPGPATFPYLRRRGPLALIGVSAATPAAPFMATGALGAAQIAALGALLDALANEPSFRVLLIHYPPRSSASHWHKRLTDGRALLALLRTRRVDLVLHGHDHRHALAWIEGPSGPVPVLGVPSASAANDGSGDAAAWNMLQIAPDGAGWRCDLRVRGFERGAEDIVDLAGRRLI